MFTLFNTLDGVCSFMPAGLRVGLYGLITGVLAMLIYWRISPQGRIRALQAQISEAQRALRGYKGTDLGQMMRLCGQAVLPAVRQVLLVGGPTLLAATPVLLLMAWLDSSYSHRLPEAGSVVRVTVAPSAPAGGALGWVPADGVAETLSDGRYGVRWPAEGQGARLVDVASGRELFRLPLDRPIPAHRRARWWDGVLGGGGILAADGPLSSVEIDLPGRLIWPGGPAWLCSWHATFMLALTVGALGVKFRFKIA